MFLRKETFFFVSEMVAKLRIEVEFTHDKFERQWINEKRVKTTTISLSMKRKMMR